MNLAGIARKLVTDNHLDEATAVEAIEKANKEGVQLASYLIKNNIVPSPVIAMISSQEFGLPIFDLSVMDAEMAAFALVPEKLIIKLNSVPLFKRGNRLFIAISSPTNTQALDEFKFATGLSTEAVLVQEDQLAEFIEKVSNAMDTGMEMLDDDLEDLDIGAEEEEQAGPTAADAEDAPVVKYVNKILLDAINKGASDIHFEPYEKRYRVRYRIDGILSEVASPPISIAGKLTARVKVMSRMDISERRVPQDGRIKLKAVDRNAPLIFVSTPALPCSVKKSFCVSSTHPAPSSVSMRWVTSPSKKNFT